MRRNHGKWESSPCGHNKLAHLVEELRRNPSSPRNKSGMVYGNKWRNNYERKTSQDTDGHYGQMSILWQQGHPPAPNYRMWEWEKHIEVDTTETGTDAKNCPRANSEWVDHAATLHNVAPSATASGAVGVSECRLLSHTNATWTDSARPPWLSETGKMEDVPEEELNILEREHHAGQWTWLEREGTLDEAHWPQAGSTRGMTTPEVSVVIQRCSRNHVYCWTVKHTASQGQDLDNSTLYVRVSYQHLL
jgi:hypothetical protein